MPLHCITFISGPLLGWSRCPSPSFIDQTEKAVLCVVTVVLGSKDEECKATAYKGTLSALCPVLYGTFSTECSRGMWNWSNLNVKNPISELFLSSSPFESSWKDWGLMYPVDTSHKSKHGTQSTVNRLTSSYDSVTEFRGFNSSSLLLKPYQFTFFIWGKPSKHARPRWL